jgi:hypothetical protein
MASSFHFSLLDHPLTRQMNFSVQPAPPAPTVHVVQPSFAHRNNAPANAPAPYHVVPPAFLHRAPAPPQLANAPANACALSPNPNTTFFVRDLDGSWVLRSVDVIVRTLQPGQWAQSESGFPYFIRTGNPANSRLYVLLALVAAVAHTYKI